MKYSKHARKRKGQRGIQDWMVELAQDFGTVSGDRTVLGRRELVGLLADVDQFRAGLLKILDKGGVGVVAKGDDVVTAYNVTKKRRDD